MDKILQLKVYLKGSKPSIWRRFLVKDSVSFEELHEIIQEIMGWENYHLYEFRINNMRIAPEEPGSEGFSVAEEALDKISKSPEFLKMIKGANLERGSVSLDVDKINKILEKERARKEDDLGTHTILAEVVKKEKMKIGYRYDFGDCWEHIINVEKIFDKVPANVRNIPICLDGKMACPPEDCGGLWGYEEMLEIKKDKNHPQYQDKIVNWLGEEFDSEEFDMEEINKEL